MGGILALSQGPNTSIVNVLASQQINIGSLRLMRSLLTIVVTLKIASSLLRGETTSIQCSGRASFIQSPRSQTASSMSSRTRPSAGENILVKGKLSAASSSSCSISASETATSCSQSTEIDCHLASSLLQSCCKHMASTICLRIQRGARPRQKCSWR